MKNVLRYIGVYFSKPIWSFIRNCVFWLFRLNKIAGVKATKILLKNSSIESVMARFTWQEDKVGDWTQWVSTLIYNGLTGDCDDAAAIVWGLAGGMP